jgi:hypothetical protein
MKLMPKNWEKFQHYKHRSPPWIKLHRDILDDFDWWSLPIASRAIAPCLWLLASCEEDGEFDATPEKLAFRFRMTEKEIQLAIKPLIEKGYFVSASDTLAECYQDATSEKSKSKSKVRVETENIFIPPIPAELFTEYQAIRKSKRAAPFTERMYNSLCKQASLAGITPEKAITICCEKGWTGFEASWLKQDKQASILNAALSVFKPQYIAEQTAHIKLVGDNNADF